MNTDYLRLLYTLKHGAEFLGGANSASEARRMAQMMADRRGTPVDIHPPGDARATTIFPLDEHGRLEIR
jgi:hypothetical protein